MSAEEFDNSTNIIPEMHVFNEVPDENALSLIAQLTAIVDANAFIQADPELKALYTQNTMLRFLRARSFDLKKAAELICEDIEWRSGFKPHNIREVDIEPESMTGKMRVSPILDKYNRPVLIMHAKYENSKDYDRQLRFLVWNIERCMHMMENNVGKYSVFINMESFSIWNSPPSKVSKETAKCLSSRYPERLGTAMILNAPLYFRVVYKMLSPFIDSRTKSKIKFVTGDLNDGGEGDKLLVDLLGSNWREITGINDEKVADNVAPGYNHEVYWSRVREQEALWFNPQTEAVEEPTEITETNEVTETVDTPTNVEAEVVAAEEGIEALTVSA